MIWSLILSAWFAFWMGFVVGVVWLDHRQRRRQQRDLFRQIHGISADDWGRY